MSNKKILKKTWAISLLVMLVCSFSVFYKRVFPIGILSVVNMAFMFLYTYAAITYMKKYNEFRAYLQTKCKKVPFELVTSMFYSIGAFYIYTSTPGYRLHGPVLYLIFSLFYFAVLWFRKKGWFIKQKKEIIKYTEGIQGAIFASGRREYIVFSNSGAVQEEFNQRKLLNLQKKVQEEKKISLNVGIGTGGTMNDAEMNARRALDFSLKNAKQEIFWIDAGQTQHGPLGKEIQLEYQLISSDPKLQEISEKTGLSTTSILKIIAIADVRKSYIFDAHQLAECLGITVRSARRIMNKIMEAGYGKVYAKKTAAAGGRPKALVEILFKI